MLNYSAHSASVCTLSMHYSRYFEEILLGACQIDDIHPSHCFIFCILLLLVWLFFSASVSTTAEFKSTERLIFQMATRRNQIFSHRVGRNRNVVLKKGQAHLQWIHLVTRAVALIGNCQYFPDIVYNIETRLANHGDLWLAFRWVGMCGWFVS